MDGIGKALAIAIFQVFMQHLIAADVIVPELRCYALKVLIIVDLHGTAILIILDEFHFVIRTTTLITCYGRA